MPRKEDFNQFLIILLYMYFIQGLPYGMQAKFLPIYLRQRGYSLTHVTMLKLLYLPILLKTLYAPIIEIYLEKKMWVQISVFLLSIVCILLIFVRTYNPFYLSLGFLLMNVFSSVQDVAIDSLAITVHNSQQDVITNNVVQVVGYKIGSLFGGGVLLILSQYIHWNQLFLLMALFYLFGLFLTVFCRSFSSDSVINLVHEGKGTSSTEIKKHYADILRDSVSSQTTVLTIIFVLCYKFGEQGATSMLPLYLIDQKMKAGQIGLWCGIVGQIVSISGSACGGLLLDWYKNTHKALTHLCFIIAPLITLLVSMIGPNKHMSTYKCITLVFIFNVLSFLSGMLTTSAFMLMMQCSHQQSIHLQNTNYSVLATLEVLGKLMFMSIVGLLTDKYGYNYSYAFFAVLAWFTCLFLISSKKYFLFSGTYCEAIPIKSVTATSL